MPCFSISFGPSASALDVRELGGDLRGARGELLGAHHVRRAVDEIPRAVDPAGDPRSPLGRLGQGDVATEDQLLQLGLPAVLLPARRVVGAEDRALDYRARLLLARERQRVVDRPRDRVDELARLAHDCSGGRAQGIGVDQGGLADSGQDDAAVAGVHQARGAEVAARLAVLRDAGEQSVEVESSVLPVSVGPPAVSSTATAPASTSAGATACTSTRIAARC